MQDSQPNLFTRDDTFFGVCQGLGEDLGINPNWLRIAVPVPLFFFPVQTIAGYAAAGLLLLAVRLLFPVPRLASSAAAQPANVPVTVATEVDTLPTRTEAKPVLLAA